MLESHMLINKTSELSIACTRKMKYLPNNEDFKYLQLKQHNDFWETLQLNSRRIKRVPQLLFVNLNLKTFLDNMREM